MREISEYLPARKNDVPGEVPVYITPEEAVTIMRAFRYVMNGQQKELERILDSNESDYLKNAAAEKFNSDSEEMTKLHIDMAQIFPDAFPGGVA